jgi:hypothetical protein
VTDTEHLIRLLEGFHDEIAPMTTSNPWQDFLRKNTREKILATLMAIVLWIVLVHQQRTVSRTFHIPVEVLTAQPDLVVTKYRPHEVAVTLTGPRKAFLFLNADEIKLQHHAVDLQPGGNLIPLSAYDLSYSGDLQFAGSVPSHLTIEAQPRQPTDPSK